MSWTTVTYSCRFWNAVSSTPIVVGGTASRLSRPRATARRWIPATSSHDSRRRRDRARTFASRSQSIASAAPECRTRRRVGHTPGSGASGGSRAPRRSAPPDRHGKPRPVRPATASPGRSTARNAERSKSEAFKQHIAVSRPTSTTEAPNPALSPLPPSSTPIPLLRDPHEIRKSPYFLVGISRESRRPRVRWVRWRRL